MRLGVGEYEIRMLNEPSTEKIVKFVVTSKEVKDRNGSKFFKELSKEELFAIPAKKFVGQIPQNPHKLIVLEKGFRYATKGKKLMLV